MNYGKGATLQGFRIKKEKETKEENGMRGSKKVR